MNQDLNTVLDAALQLPIDQQKKLIERLSRPNGMGQEKTGDVTRYFGTFRSSDPRSGDNDKIDEDLASAYADDHEPEN
jgi:hypothetical protein